MQFSIIYSVDVPEGVSIKPYTPPQVGRLWTRTEGNEQFEYSYLDGRWKTGKHRKWAALLTRTQFDAFVAKLGLDAEDVQTMGSLGAPGFGFGWAPAVNFRSDDEDAIVSAFITPIPKVEDVFLQRPGLAAGQARHPQRVRRPAPTTGRMRMANDMNQVVEITSAEFEERVLRSPIPALVEFYADWCGPCRLLGPVLEDVAEELHGQVAVFKVDAPANIDLVQRHGISALTTTNIFNQGREIARLVGLQTRERMMEQVPTIPNPRSRSASS